MSVGHLPLELKNAIIENISDDKSQLLLCRFISKDFLNLATPHAFRTLNISRKRGCHAVFAGLPNESRVFQHVKQFTLRALEGKFDNLDGDTVEETASIFVHLTKFPNLDVLRLYFHDSYQEGIYEFTEENMSPIRCLQIEIFKTLANLVPNDTFLNSLEIHGLLALPNEGIRSEGIRSLLKHLSVLHISLVTNDAENFDASITDYSVFWASDMVCMLTATPNLTDFTLISDINTTAFLNNNWDIINLPRLEFLRFKNIVFTNVAYYQHRFPWLRSGGPEELIPRHQTTLKGLDLSSCWIEINDEDPHPRTWAMIWKAFEKELLHLRSFKFDPLPGRVLHGADTFERFEGYVYFLIESGYVNLFQDDPADVGLDREAFESLQSTIAKRTEYQEEK